jgi:hypothetical protein
VTLWCTYYSHQFSVNLLTELLKKKKKLPYVANTFSRVVFVCFISLQNVSPWNYMILGVSETSDLIQLIEKFPALMELEGLSL